MTNPNTTVTYDFSEVMTQPVYDAGSLGRTAVHCGGGIMAEAYVGPLEARDWSVATMLAEAGVLQRALGEA